MKTVYTGALVYRTNEADFAVANVVCENGIITKITNDSPSSCNRTVDLSGKYLIPGLVDVHTHGRIGFDFNDVSESDLPSLLRSYAESGTTTVMPALASAPFDEYFTAITNIKKVGNSYANIAGVHVEGRYLSPKKRGAHAENLLALPSVEELDMLLDAIAPMNALISVAPELEGSEQFIRHAAERGATVSLAHSDATYDESLNALTWGANSFTHTFNAMRSLHHREPGNAAASLLADDAYSEFICDGFHIHPEMIRLASRVKCPDKFVLITDSLSAAGFSDGEYSIAGIPVTVTNGMAINSEGAIAGSTISLLDGLRNYIKFTGEAPELAIRKATKNPAEMIGVYDICGEIAVGKRADMLVTSSLSELPIDGIILSGEKIK